MQQSTPGGVLFLEIGTIDDTVREIAGAVGPASTRSSGLQLLDILLVWLRETRPNNRLPVDGELRL
jgi:hypothetical protein